MRDEYCEACNTLKEDASVFATNGVTNNISNRLKDDKGFSSVNTVDTDCEALNIGNDCLIGGQEDTLENYDVCEIKGWLKESWANLHTMLKAIIASICGLWSKVHCILSGLKILLQQLTNTSSFAAEANYAIALGSGNGAHIDIYKQQIVVPKITNTAAQASGYNDRSTITEEVRYTSSNRPFIRSTIVGPDDLDEIVYPSDGVALVGCCLYTEDTKIGENISLEIAFYTDKDTQNLGTIRDTRGMHYSFNPGSGVDSSHNQAYNFSSAIKVKAGSKLRIFIDPSNRSYPRNGQGQIDVPTGDPTHDADLTYPWNQTAKATVHQVYSVFIPDFASALAMNIDEDLFDNCGE